MKQTTFYKLTDEEIKRVESNFTYHAPIIDQPARYEVLRNMAKGLALQILHTCPPSRERSLALTKLEEAVMWANAAIARNESIQDFLPTEEAEAK